MEAAELMEEIGVRKGSGMEETLAMECSIMLLVDMDCKNNGH